MKDYQFENTIIDIPNEPKNSTFTAKGDECLFALLVTNAVMDMARKEERDPIEYAYELKEKADQL